MKWFKHEASASRSQSLALLRAVCGLEGYGFYWGVLEVLAESCEEIDESGEVSVTLPTKIWCGTLNITPQKFKKLLETCANFGLFSVSLSEVGGKKVIRIGSKDIASRADEYTSRKASRQRKGQEVSGQCLDTIGTMSVQNRIEESRREENREEDIKESCISDEIREDFPSSTCPDSEKEISSEATESESLETASSPKRKTAVDDNDRNRNGSDGDDKATGAEDENLEDCEKDHDNVCALGMGADSSGGASVRDGTDDNVYYFEGSREHNDAGHEQTAPVNCPHKEIVALYNEILPELRQVRSWNATREKRLRARWREDKRRQSLSWWRSYFERVRASSFLVGKKTDWAADFDWLIRPTNMAKVLEGKYDDSPPNESALQKQQGKTNIETLFRELVSSWPADRIGDMQAAKKTFCSFFADVDEVGIDEGNRRLKNLEAWALVVLEREPQYVPRLDRWLAGVDVSIQPPESKPAQYEWVPVEDGELEAVAP
jgi:hypothetical protein